MQPGQLPSQSIQFGRQGGVGGRQALVEHLLGRQAAHVDRVFEHRAGASHAQPRRCLPNADDIEVGVGSEPPIQAHLFFAEKAAALQCGKIEKAEIDRFLDLVNVVRSQVKAQTWVSWNSIGPPGGRIRFRADMA